MKYLFQFFKIKRCIRLNLFFLLLSLFFSGGIYSQTSIFYVSSGNWSAPANWIGGVPTASSTVIISDGAVCTVDIPSAQCASLSFSSNTVSNRLQFAVGSDLTVTGAISFSAPSVDGCSQTIAVGGALLRCGSINFADCANGGARTNNVTISTGSVSVLGNIAFSGAANENYISFSDAGALSVGGNMSGLGTLDPSNGTVFFTGAAQTINSYTYNNVVITGSGIKTLITAVTIGGTLTVNSGGSVVLGGTSNVTSIGGDVIVTNNSRLSLGSVASGNKLINVAGNVQIDNGSTIDVAAYTAAHSLSVAGNITNNGTLDLFKSGGQSARLNLLGTLSQMLLGGGDCEFDNVLVNNASGVISGFLNMQIAGTLTLTAGVFDIQNNTLTFYTSNTPLARTAGVLQAGSSSSINFGASGLTGGNAFTLPSNIFASNPLSIGTLSINRSNSLVLGNQGLTVLGSISLVSGLFSIGANTLTVNGPVPFVRTAGVLLTSSGSLVFGANTATAQLPDNLFSTSPMSIANLTVNRAGGLLLNNQDVSVTGTTTLTSGVIVIGNADMQVATIAGTPSATAMIVCAGTGFLKRAFATGASSFTFPLGDTVGVKEYSPLRLSFTANAVAGIVSVKAINAKHPQNTELTNYLNRYWTINAPTLTTYTYTTTMSYQAADVVGSDEANLRLQRYNQSTSSWTVDNASVSSVVSHQISSGSLTQATGTLHLNDVSAWGSDVYYWSKTSGNWNGATTWEVSNSPLDPGVGNGAATSVAPTWNNNKGIVIRSGTTVTNNASTYTASRLLIAGTLNVGANTLSLYDAGLNDVTLNGTLIASGGQLLAATSDVDVSVNGLFQTSDVDGFMGTIATSISSVNAPTVVLNAGSVVEYNSASAQSVSALDYIGLKLSGGSTKTVGGAVVVAENLVITGTNTHVVTASQMDILGNVSITSSAASVFGGNSSVLNIAGNVNIASSSNWYIGNTAGQSKSLVIGGAVNIDATSGMYAGAVAATEQLAINGVLNSLGSFVMWRAAGQVCNVTLTPTADMYLAGTTTFNDVVFGSSVVPTTVSQNGAVTLRGNLSIGSNIIYSNNAKVLTSYGNIAIAAGGELDILSSATAAAQLIMSNTKNIDNAGIFKAIGTSSFPSIISGSAANYYNISQTLAGAQFHAKYAQFNYLNGTLGGIVLSAGLLDNTNNFSYCSFANGNGVQYVNVTGLDMSSITNSIVNARFNAGPTFNVTRTSGIGAITFEDASGALAGENFDNDDANPGTLVMWGNPSTTFYSQGTGLFSSLSNWNSNPAGGGAWPTATDLTSGLATFVVMDDDIVTVDQDIDIYKLQVGTGSTGTITLGDNTTIRTVIIESDIIVKPNATINSAAYDAIQNLVVKGNIVNDGTIDLFESSVRQTKIIFSGVGSQISGIGVCIFGDFSIAAGKVVTANRGLNIDGSVSIGAASVFNTGSYVHTVAGNWASLGVHNSSGTIEFDGLAVSDISTTATFYNLILKNPVSRIIGTPIYINNSFSVLNACKAIASGAINVFVRGDMEIDATSTYTQTAGALVFDGAVSQLINLQGGTPAVFSQLVFRNGGALPKTINGNIVNASLTLGGAAATSMFVESTATVEGVNSVSLSGGLRVDGICNLSGRVELLGGNLSTGNVSNTFTLGTARLVINGQVNVTYIAPATACTVIVNDNVDVVSNYLVLNNNTFLQGNGGDFTVQTANLYVRGVDNFPMGFVNYNLSSTSSTLYDGNISQTVRGGAGLIYGNLYLRNASLTTKTADGDVQINGILELGSSGTTTAFVTNYSVSVTGNINNSNNSSITQSASGVFAFNGDNAQTLANGTYQFGNLQFSTNYLNAAITKNCAIANPIVLLGSFSATNLGGDNIKLLYINLGSTRFTGGGTGVFQVGSNVEVQTQATSGLQSFAAAVLANFIDVQLHQQSTIHYNNTLANQEIASITQPYGNLFLSGSNQKLAVGALNIDGMFRAVSATPVFYDGGFTHRVEGDWLLGPSNYIAASATGTIVLDGANQAIYNTNFNNLVLAGTDSKTLFGNLNTVFGSLTIGDDVTFDADIYSISIKGNWVNPGTGVFKHSNTSNSWVMFTGASNQTIANANGYFNLLYINKPNPAGAQTVRFLTDVEVNSSFKLYAGAGVADVSNVTLRIGGNMVVDSNVVETGLTLITTGGTIVFDGTVVQNIYNRNTNPLTFNDLRFEGTGDKQFDWYNGVITSLLIGTPASRLVDINGSVWITGSVVNGNGWGAGGVDFTVAGDWNNGGTFVHNRTVTFDGANQQISKSNFGSVAFLGTDTKTLAGDLSATNSVTINSTLDVGANNNISLGGAWVNNGKFLARQGAVTFVGSSVSDVTTGAIGYPQPYNSFYDVQINKVSGNYIRFVGTASDAVISNDLVINSGTLQTNAFDMWIGGNFLNLSTQAISHNNSNSVITFNAQSGQKTVNPGLGTYGFIEIANDAAVKTVLTSSWSINQDFTLTSGYIKLNGQLMSMSGTNTDILINGGTFDVDSAASVLFASNNERIVNAGGNLRIVGSPVAAAKINRTAGTYSIVQTAGSFAARNYLIDQTSGISISGGTVDVLNNFSDGAINPGANNAICLNFDNFPINNATNLKIKNLIFNNGGYAGIKNIKRQSPAVAPDNGYVELQDANGNIAGAAFEVDDAGASTGNVRWTQPNGFYWVGLDVVDNTDWNRPANWASGQVPDDTSKVYLNHTYVSGAYTVNIQNARALAQRLVLSNVPAGGAITLVLKNNQSLAVGEDVVIGANTTLSLTNDSDTLYVGGNWSNSGTFNHGSSTVVFNGSVGLYSIASGGMTAGKSFYNVTINSSGSVYSLSQALDVDHTVTIVSGTLSANSFDMTVGGDWFNSGSGVFVPALRTVTFDGTVQTIDGSPFYNIAFAGSSVKTLNSNLDVNGSLSIASSVVFDGLDKTISVAGNWNNNGGLFKQNGIGTVVFDAASGTQLVDNGSSETNFNNLSFANAGNKTFNKNTNVEGDLFIASSSTGSVNVQTYTITGIGATNSFFNYGTLTVQGANNFPAAFETISMSPTSFVDYASNLNQTVVSTTYGNLRLRRASSGTTIKTAAGDLTILGSLYLNSDNQTVLDMQTNDADIVLSNTIYLTTGSYISWGTGNSTLFHVGNEWSIPSNLGTVNNLVLQGTNNKWLNGDVIATGNVTVQNNVSFYMCGWYNGSLYHTLKCTAADKTLTLLDGASLLNYTPSAAGVAFPSGFAQYDVASNSTVYLNSPNGLNQTLLSSVVYGFLNFNNLKTVTSDGLFNLRCEGNFNTNTSTYVDGGKDLYLAGGANNVSYYTPSSTARKLVLSGGNQYLYDPNENNLVLSNVVFANSGTKVFGDGNDVISISSALEVAAGVSVSSNRNITFSGTNWLDNGTFIHSGGTLSFTSTLPVSIVPGESGAMFNALTFSGNSVKTFSARGADINGVIALTAGTVDFGNLSHTISSNISNSGGTFISNLASFTFDGNSQNIQTTFPSATFFAKDIVLSNPGASFVTKTMYENWNINNLTIGTVTTLDASSSNYQITLSGNWDNAGNFYGRAGKVVFAASSNVSINNPANGLSNNGAYNFYDVVFGDGSVANYTLLAPVTLIARAANVSTDATVLLHSNTLILGSNIASGKNYAIAGTLSVNENAKLLFNNQGSICTMDVTGTLQLLGSDNLNIATVSRQIQGGHQINITTGTIAARYYLIEYLSSAGLNVLPTATLDAVNNFSDGTWANIANVVGARYLQLNMANYSGSVIKNIAFNSSFSPVLASIFNVKRTTATPVITFDDVLSGNLGEYLYEDDDNSAISGTLRWPSVSSVTWTGAVSNDWHNPDNWLPKAVPTVSITANIPSVLRSPVISSADAFCKNLNITNGSLSVGGGYNLTASNDVIIGTANNSAILAVNSSFSDIYVSGNWMRGTNGVFVHGNATVHFVSGYGTATITPMSSPFYNVEINNQLTTFYFSGNLNVKGSIVIEEGRLVPSTSNYIVTVAGDFLINNGSFSNATVGAVSLNGANQTVKNGNFYRLRIKGTGVKTLTESFSLKDTLSVYASLVSTAGFSMMLNGDVIIYPTGSFDDAGETHQFFGSKWMSQGTYTGSGTIIFAGSRNQSFGPAVFNNLVLNTAAGFATSLLDNVSVLGDVTLKTTSQYLNCATYHITNTSGTGVFTIEANRLMYVRGADNFPDNFAVYQLDPTSQVRYDGVIDQSIRGGITYGNLYLYNPTLKVLDNDVTIGGNLTINNAQLDVSVNNYTLELQGHWYNNQLISGVTGSFVPRQGKVLFTGDLSSQYIYLYGTSTQNPFYDLVIDKSAGQLVAPGGVDNTIKNSLLVYDGKYHPNGRISYVGGDLIVTSGMLVSSGRFYLNSTLPTASIQTNASQFQYLTINAPGTVYTQSDDLDVTQDFNLISGTLNANGKTNMFGNWQNNLVTISGTYIVGAGGFMRVAYGVNVVVTASGVLEVVGESGRLATITQGRNNGYHGVQIDGTIKAKYAQFEYSDVNGLNVTSSGYVDPSNNFSYSTFTNGTSNGTYLKIDNNQDLVTDSIVDASFPVALGGVGSNVTKSVAVGKIKFYNATGVFAGELFDKDDNDLINWRGPVTLTWNGSVNSDWFNSANWTASNGQIGLIPSSKHKVVIASTVTQPVITYSGNIASLDTLAAAKNLTINSGAVLKIATSSADSLDLFVNGDLTIDGQLILSTTNDSIAVAGNWIKSATGTATCNGAVVFTGVNNSKSINNGSSSFYNLYINGNTSFQLASNTSVRNNLSILAGVLNASASNYNLTVGGNWINYGTFLPYNGQVILNAASGSKVIAAGASSFNILSFNAPNVKYSLTGSTAVSSILNLQNGILDLNGQTLLFGDNIGSDVLNVYGGIFEIDAGAVLKMGAGSSLSVSAPGTFKLLGSPALDAIISNQSVGSYNITINSGTLSARYYTIDDIGANGLWLKAGAVIDPANNLSNGSFTNGSSGGTYLRFDNSFTPGLDADTIRNVAFNAGASNNVMRSSVLPCVVLKDATGVLAGYLYENDNADPFTGAVRWSYTNPVISWTGAVSSQWNNPLNWMPQLPPDSTLMVEIRNVSGSGGYPCIIDNTTGDASCKKLSIFAGASLTLNDSKSLLIDGDVNNSGTFKVSSASRITMRGQWANSSTFLPGQSTLVLAAPLGVKTITPGASSFYNLELSAPAATYRLAANTKVLSNLNLVSGVFDVSASNYSLSVGGNFTNAATFMPRLGTVQLNGASDQVITNPLGAFYNVTKPSTGGAGKIILGSNIDIDKDFTMSKALLDGNAYTITLGGNWAFSGASVTASNVSVVFDGSVSKTISSSVPLSFNKFIINKTAGKEVVLNTSISVADQFYLQQGNINISGKSLTLTGTSLVGSGTITASQASDIVVAGNGAFGALAFTAGFRNVRDFTVNRIGGSVTLASPLTVNRNLYLTNGLFQLNGNALTLANNPMPNIITVTNGTLSAAPSFGASVDVVYNSALPVVTDKEIPNAVGVLRNLTVNGTGGVTLSQNLAAKGIIAFSKGAMVLNGKVLTIDGSLQTTLGTITGDASANIVINGKSSLGGTLNFTPGAQIINTITLNRNPSGLAVIGSDLSVDKLVLTNGEFGIGAGTNLSLNNSITYTNGVLTGSPTSKLTLNGSGALSLKFGASKLLHSLDINRSGVVSLSSALTVYKDLYLRLGTLNNSNVMFPLTLIADATVYRYSGALSAAPSFGSSVNVQYLGSGDISSGFEIPASTTVLKNLTINRSSDSRVKALTDITLNSQLILLSGRLDVRSNNKTLIMPAGTSVYPLQGSQKSFVIGYVRKKGNTEFNFPLGDIVGVDTVWAPLKISAPSNSTDVFDVAYFYSSITNDLSVSTIYNMTGGLYWVTQREYWMVNRDASTTSAPAVTLYWKDASHHSITNLPDLTIAHWDASANLWLRQEYGSTASGTLDSGSITSNVPFASYCPVEYGSVSNTNPLPLELLSFKALYRNSKVQLNWITASEHNTARFVVERSVDGQSFTPIDTLLAAGVSRIRVDYETIDLNPLAGYSYYRLKMLDLDGTCTYSSIQTIKIDIANSSSQAELLPTVASNASSLRFKAAGYLPHQPLHMQLSSMSGVVLNTIMVNCNEVGYVSIAPFLGLDLPKGIYLLQLVTDNSTQAFRFVLE